MKHLILILFILSSQYVLAQRWSQADFEIVQDNEILDLGLAGGLNAPQFYQEDINLDGIDDIIVFDRDGYKTLVLRGQISGDCLEYRVDDELASYFPAMFRFMVLKDYNMDGIPDIFSYNFLSLPSSSINLYKGIAKSDHIEFERVILNQNYRNVLAVRRNTGLSNVPCSPIDLPGIGDVDGDGDLDILTFPSSGGRLEFYRNMQIEENLADDAIIFTEATQCWGGFYESDSSPEVFLSEESGDCATPLNGGADVRHNGSSTLIFDPNRDGLTDILIGDFTSDNLALLHNGGTTQEAWITKQDALFPSYDQSVDMLTFLASFQIDVNCDNKKDMLVAPNITNSSFKTNNVLYYENTGVFQDTFTYRNNSFLIGDMLDFGFASSPTLIDLNSDGWLDIVVGTGVDMSQANLPPTGLISLLHNGDATQPQFKISDEDYLGLSVYANFSLGFSPTFADMDSDGDMDIIVGDIEGFLIYGENVAGPGQPINIPAVIYGWQGIDAGVNVVPTAVDLNGDGLLDLVIGERSLNNDINGGPPCGNVLYYQNQGTASEPFFNPNEKILPNLNCLGEINTLSPYLLDANAAPTFYQTGDSLILLVGTNNGNIERYSVGNLGEKFILIDSFVGQLDDGFVTRPVLGDLDQDEVLEIVVGNQRGGISIYHTNIKTDGSLLSANRDIVELSASIFPNPVISGGLLTITAVPGVFSIELYDTSGKLVMLQKELQGDQQLKLPSIAKGLYFMLIHNSESTVTKKIIIN